MSRYGFHDAAASVARDVSDAASFFESYRLPELFAGVQRGHRSFPIQYRGANVPQAWAAGSAFQLLQTLLGIQANAPSDALYVDPHLPAWLPDVTLRALRVGTSAVDLHVWLDEEGSHWDASVLGGDLEVTQRPWAPWQVAGIPIDAAHG